ncbi:SCO2522 family protein [Nocardia sp. NPDC050710]|uniref:SCO2522 family protein n=1 Tax=Nocardia sp. NPDC050710 TaxID=3157220 RepID=UPI0033CE4358
MSHSAGYSEATASTKIDEVGLSHLSIEVGHFYMDHLTNGEERIRAQFEAVAPLVEAFTYGARAQFGPQARVSTCFLIDDYFRPDPSPAPILDRLLTIAAECGLTIDYLAREAACWEMPVWAEGSPTEERIELAELVASRIVAEPQRNSNGGRPPTTESGWLCNGRRASDSEPMLAMHNKPYMPAEELGRREHSIFLDVEMWNKPTRKVNGVPETYTKWSCPFLASVWQLLRLGMLRDAGAAVVDPVPWQVGRRWPEKWWDMPGVIQLTEKPAPFAAYRALSILPHRYLGIEHAVKVILGHIDIDEEILEQMIARGRDEGIGVPRLVTDRISHHLLYGS